MFLFAITKKEIAHNFQHTEIEEFGANSSNITVITDNFLSRCFSDTVGVILIESPLISSPNFRDVIFSQVIYNKNNNIVNIFKSTMSGRPIYYHLNRKGEFFCSTHISMLRKAGVPIEENTEVLPEFFVYRYIMPPQTLYKNIKQLLPGSRLHIKLINEKCRIVCMKEYVPSLPSVKFSGKIDTISDHTRSILNESIQALAPSKDRISVLLSGGLDSSILFKICKKKYGIDTTFSTGYPFEHPDKNIEKEYAISAARSFKVNHNYYDPSYKDYLNGFIEAIDSAEMPLHHLQSILLYLIFKNGIPKNRDIIISGEGAEGPFGWEEYHNKIYNLENNMLNQFFLIYPFQRMLDVTSRITGVMRGRYLALKKISESSNLSIKSSGHLIWSMGSYGYSRWVREYFNTEGDDIIKDRYKNIEKFSNRSIYDLLSILCFYGEDSVTQTIWSKIGEKNNKILYYPYYDKKLLDYVYSIPWHLKLKNPKIILREVARKLKIPEYIITRPKSGFGLRTNGWAEKGGVFDPLVPLASKVFDEKQICKMRSDDPKRAMTLWNILNYAIWKRLFIQNEPVDILLEELNEKI